ncbi:MAG: S41 family peptidase [Terriglobales bacterium]
MKTFARVLFFCVLVSAFAGAQTALLHHPAVNSNQLVFTYGDDLWSGPRDGGPAHPLTTGDGTKADPFLSPDGKWIAYSGTYDGNTDVYVMPAEGGVPKRLTFHPGADVVQGWTPDSQAVLFRSGRNSYSRFTRLFTVGLAGGLPHEMPLPEGEMGSFSPDGKYLAYVPVWNWGGATAWKRYHGGRQGRIWIARLSDSHVDEIPRKDSNDFCPMWVGDKIYFLSDRSGAVSLFVYDTRSKKVDPLLPGVSSDIKWASATPDAIVYEQLGSLHKLDLKSLKSAELKFAVAGDLPSLRPHFEKVASAVENYGISPSGVRAVFEAHGEILTVPAEHGDIRDLTNTTGSAERDPAWSPDGKWIAYFSDASGEYELHLSSQDGTQTKKLALGDAPSYYYEPVWSPDAKKIAYTDKRLNVWYIDLASGKSVKIDTNTYETPQHTLDPSWSPDSKWITYTKLLPSHMRAVCVYSTESGKATQITDGMSDARFALFDKNGKYLYFTASTNSGPTNGWLDLSSIAWPATRSVYVVVLRNDLPSPIAPLSDDEKSVEKSGTTAVLATADAGVTVETPVLQQEAQQTEKEKAVGNEPEKAKKPEPVSVRIDLQDIGQRILALPIPARNYVGMEAGASGTLFLTEASVLPGFAGGTPGNSIYRFELEARKTQPIVAGVSAFRLSQDGKKMLYRQGFGQAGKWMIAAVPPPTRPDAPPSMGEGAQGPRVAGMPLKTDEMQVYVDPRAEWGQMYHEVWRIERDFFYDPNLHGVNWRAAEKEYQPLVNVAASRGDITDIFTDMLGELSVGHMFVRGPQPPPSDQPKTGLLGADYIIENGRYKFLKVYYGENWNPELRAPLTEPGVNVKTGEYLLAVNGRELKGSDNIFELFLATGGKSTTLKVGADPTGKGARTVSVVPIENETLLRNRAWMDANRQKVDELSDGKLAYVYLPDTSVGGWTNFNRYYFAQVGRAGAVLDERFNGGGSAADYIIDNLRRPLMNKWMTREGSDFSTVLAAIYGPKVMITNMYAGSGGDALPWYFRHEKIGKLIGTRTWGGLVGIYDYPPLIDGGSVTAPRVAFYNLNGEWDVENHGVPPDVDVPFDPAAWRQGHDPQLEKAVAVALDETKASPTKVVERPAFPNYHPSPTSKAAGGGQ